MAVRNIIEIDEELCNGCGQCIGSCAEGALALVDGKARLVKDIYCDGLGACLGHCPTGALKIIERDAPEFDEHAAMAHVEATRKAEAKPEDKLPCGCPGSQVRLLTPLGGAAAPSCACAGGPASDLSHWPVKIRLVPAGAPFLRGADLLVAADCAPAACPDFHERFLRGRAVMMGCPKFDDAEGYVEKFKDVILNSGVRKLTILRMEVPCCAGMSAIVAEAMRRAGKTVPVEEVVLSRTGVVAQRTKSGA